MSIIPAFDRDRFLRGFLTLGLGGACGYLASRIGMPLPWILGPMIGVTIAALSGARVYGSPQFRAGVIPVVGVMLGSAFTMDVLSAAAQWTLTLVLILPFMMVAALMSFTVYRRIGRFDPVTAFFCAMPGGLNEMMQLGMERGGDERRIALAHTSRLMLVVMIVGLFFGLTYGVASSDSRPQVAMSALTLRDWAILGACAVVGYVLGKRLRIPAGTIFAPMILSGIAHVTGIVTIAPPTVMVNGAQIVIGTVIGCRFLGKALREVGFELVLGLISTSSMIALALGFGWVVASAAGMPLTQTFLAFSPGGLTEMSLLALAMGQEVTYVAVTHLLRIVIAVAASVPLFGWLSRWM